MINLEVFNKRVKMCWNKRSILHAIICIYILYESCLPILYMMFMMCTFRRSELIYKKCIQNVWMQNVSHISTNSCIHFAYKMYTKCIQHVCIQNVFHISKKCLHKTSISHFHKRLQTFCMQNLAGIVFLIFYTKCIQKFVERWYTFCIQLVYI